MTTDLAIYQAPRSTSLELAVPLWQVAEKLAGTEFVPVALRGKPESVLACMLTGHELGLEMMQSLAKIHIIEGRPALSAEVMRAIVLSHGHEIEFEETTSTRCTIRGRRRGAERWTKVEWSIDDARKAGIQGKQVWTKYPGAMLIARATGQLCRMIFADDLAGISYTAEELEDGIDPALPLATEIAGPATTAPKTARARKAITAPAPADDPAPPPPAPRGEVPDLPEPDEASAQPDDADDDIIDPPAPELPAEPIARAVADPAAAEAETAAAIDAEEWPSGEWPSGDFPTPEEPIVDGRRYTGPQLIAIRLGKRFGITGNTDAARRERLQAIEVLIGRPITTSKDLTPEEIADICQRIDATPTPADGTFASILDVPGAHLPEVAPPAPAKPERHLKAVPHDPELWTGDEWRAFLAARKVKVTETMREAQRLAGTLDPPISIGTLDDIAGSGLATELLGWIEDLSLERKQ